MSFTDTISTQQLKEIIKHPGLIIVDCRFELSDPQKEKNEYENAHIPGAFYAHLDKDLASPVTPQSGRHPLPEADSFSKLLNSWSVTRDSQIVVYDNASGAMAVRLWWLLNLYGFDNVAVLDGGIDRWVKDGFELSNEIPASKGNTPDAALYHPRPSLYVTTDEMLDIYQNKEYKIIDARTPARYQGKHEPIDAVAGHIPGAVNRFHGDNLTEKGMLKSAEVLKNEFSELIGSTDPHKVIVYCGSGVTSCHHLLALKRAGIEGVRLYVGSWSEWIRDPNRPIGLG